ncbi:MAG TPA: hypothetical protein VNJ08_06265 [Bacteriovoracaceae bacterium]|nr:hypothetical protein [Bacteriovoracaceae bacterium]
MIKFLGFLLFCLSIGAHAESLSLDGFHKRFHLERNSDGKVKAIRLKVATTRISVLPLLDQLQHDLVGEQNALNEEEALKLLSELGDNKEVKHLQTAIKTLKKISIKTVFKKLKKENFWNKADKEINKALIYTDPSYLANLEDPRFFYKKRVAFKIIRILLDLAQGQFLDIPVLNMATFIIKRIHWMMMEQRHFHHNMLLYYFETFTPEEMGMTENEVRETISSIYEYRISSFENAESKWASKNWNQYGIINFYNQNYNDTKRMSVWQEKLKLPYATRMNFGFAFSGCKIYHLHVNNHFFSDRPSLAFDADKPYKIKYLRGLLNIAGLTLGFISVPGLVIKDAVTEFLESIYIKQVRMEGALVAYYESRGDKVMAHHIYQQRANFYIVE